MRIEIHAGNFDLTESLREHIERRIQFTLSWSQHSLQKVIVRLDDINGPKGGADKSCRIQIPVAGGKSCGH
jgi:putative sigma-54 modulation protein